MSSSFISLSRTPVVLSQSPVSLQGEEALQISKALVIPPPPAKRKARPKLAPGLSLPSTPEAAPQARATASAARAARKPSALPVPSSAEELLELGFDTDELGDVDRKGRHAAATADDELEELDFESADWETTGMRLRRHVRRWLALATKRKH